MEEVVLPGARDLSDEGSRRKSESTGPAQLRLTKKRRPEAELGGPLPTSLPDGLRGAETGPRGRGPYRIFLAFADTFPTARRAHGKS